MISSVYFSFYLNFSWTIRYMVIKSLLIFCFLLDELLTLLWVFNLFWYNGSRSGKCVGRRYQVCGEFVGCGYPVGGVGIWLLSVSSSPCSTLSLSNSWSERVIIGFGDDQYF